MTLSLIWEKKKRSYEQKVLHMYIPSDKRKIVCMRNRLLFKEELVFLSKAIVIAEKSG